MNENKEKVIVRFPPSPTGFLHMGSVRTALYNYLFARKNGGKFILRIEDTDKERSQKQFESYIFDGLKWLGLSYDNEGDVWRQSERTEVYKAKIQELIQSGAAYISQETEGENKEVVRFKNPCVKIKFDDIIRGQVEMDTSDLKDFVIAKSVEEPLYHLTVVVDDMASGVTHIIRGEDHISNTPRQILIARALGKNEDFKFAHLPLVLAEDKSKLSKRKHGESVSLKNYIDKGYEPEAILNFMALLGWNPGGEREIFGLEELVEIFDLSKVQKKGGIFNVEKLDWINREHILRQPEEIKFSIFNSEFSKTKWGSNDKKNDVEFMQKFLKIILDRIHRWGEVGEAIEAGEFDYLFEKPKLDISKICWKGQNGDGAKKNLEAVLEIIKLREADYELCKEEIMNLAEKEGKGNVLWPLRYSLSGREKSPDPLTLLSILDHEESQSRILDAINLLA